MTGGRNLVDEGESSGGEANVDGSSDDRTKRKKKKAAGVAAEKGLGGRKESLSGNTRLGWIAVGARGREEEPRKERKKRKKRDEPRGEEKEKEEAWIGARWR